MSGKKELAQTPEDQTLMPTMTADGVVAHRTLIKDVIHRVMKKDVHYGVIPGTDKPTLYKPGAEVLCLTFRLSPIFESREVMDGNHMTAFSRCTLQHIPSGRDFGSGEAVCSTKEKKYAKRKENGRIVDNQNLPDSWNTVVKIGNKRALVAAILVATAASDEFTQDMASDDEKPEPLVVVDTEAQVKEPAPEKKEAEKPVETPTEKKVSTWRGKLEKIEVLELPGGRRAWSLHADGQEFKTQVEAHQMQARTCINRKEECVIEFWTNAKGTQVVDTITVEDKTHG